MKTHHYKTRLDWTGNRGAGTLGYSGYDRSYSIQSESKELIHASADPAFLGDATKYNPEELFLAALSSCHMLWYLHLCADNGIIVTAYRDEASGTMRDTGKGGSFIEVILHPAVTILDESKIELANSLHKEAAKCCFIANSCNFPVKHESTCMAI